MPRSYEALFANRKLIKKKQKYYFILLSLLILKKTANLVMYWGFNFGLIVYNFRCNRVNRFNPFEPHIINRGVLIFIFMMEYKEGFESRHIEYPTPLYSFFASIISKNKVKTKIN
ncbi:hypothetical protein BpHYR1_022262 [Brachionus plicatilis]|uniref:Uncharacterized protein n=1 Tax=Brachionus plicatilis TaxID=10195 RepID=A0A3M7PS54_BRAPC|nr:hypothetical protein BpHYR1_022262 [Brachionus plicatilis]